MKKFILLTLALCSFIIESNAQIPQCDITINSGSSGNISVANGKTVCVDINYSSSNITIATGGTLIIKEGKTLNSGWQNIGNNGKIINLGTLQINLQNNSSVNIDNYGTLSGGLSYKNATIKNFPGGTVNLTNYSAFDNVQFINQGIFTGSLATYTNGTIKNDFGASLTLSASSGSSLTDVQLTNEGTLTRTVGHLLFQGSNGTLINSGNFNLVNSSNFTFNAASFRNTGTVLISATDGSSFKGGLQNSGSFSIFKLTGLEATVTNFGLMKFYTAVNNIAASTILYNDATMEFVDIAEVQFNGALLTNNGRISVPAGKFKLNNSSAEIVNNGIIITSDNFEINASGIKVINNCRIVSGKNIPVSNGANVTNNGLLWASEDLTLNGADVKFENSLTGFVRGKNFVNSGKVSGQGQFYFTGTTNNNGGSILGDAPSNPILFYDASQTGSQIVDMGNVPVNTIRPTSMTLLDTTNYECSAPTGAAGFPPTVSDTTMEYTLADTVVFDISNSMSPYDNSYSLHYNCLQLFSEGGHEMTNNLVIPNIGQFIIDINNKKVSFIKDANFTGSEIKIEYIIANAQSASSPLYYSARRKVTLKKSDILPIKLGSFEVKENDNKALLTWTTLSEKNTNYFEIERSGNGNTFKSLPVKVAALGENNTPQTYSVEDEQPFNGDNFYRLKIYDLDGKVSFSEIRRLSFNSAAEALQVYPIPTSGLLNIKGEAGNFNQIIIYALNGAVVYNNNNVKDEITTVDMQSLPAGNYLLKVIFNQGSSKTMKIIKK